MHGGFLWEISCRTRMHRWNIQTKKHQPWTMNLAGKYIWVNDDHGWYPQRVISMIINEAYFAYGRWYKAGKLIQPWSLDNYPFGPLNGPNKSGCKCLFPAEEADCCKQPLSDPSGLLKQNNNNLFWHLSSTRYGTYAGNCFSKPATLKCLVQKMPVQVWSCILGTAGDKKVLEKSSRFALSSVIDAVICCL